MNNIPKFKIGEHAIMSPVIINKDNWVKGEVIQIENNPFKGVVISVKTPDGNIFFDQEQYSQKAS